MKKKQKILIVRFSSIGDIILTTPLVRCLKLQLNATVHYLTKEKYSNLLIRNQNIDKLILLNENLTSDLKKENYDLVVDLHNNIRSYKIKKSINALTYTISKNTFKRYLLIYFGINLLNNHIVDRYFNTVKKINVINDDKGIDYDIDAKNDINFNINQQYITWCIGGSYIQKRLSIKQIVEVIKKIDLPIVLLGGDEERSSALEIINQINSDKIYNFCGESTIDQSAYLIKNSKLFLTNDTGLMHIATSFAVPIIAFWGCTKPTLGFSAYRPKAKVYDIISDISDIPCSKHGSYCRFSKTGCIKKISSNEIYNEVVKEIKIN